MLADGGDRYIRGGGVSVYLRDSFTYTLIATSDNLNLNTPEYLIVNVKVHLHSNVLIAVLYRRPHGYVISDFINNFSSIMHLYKNIIIMGDFNSDMLKQYYESIYIQNFISEYALHLVPHGATHHIGESNSHLDLMIVDSCDKVVMHDKSASPFIAGHDYIFLDFQLRVVCPTTKVVKSRDFRNFAPDVFKQFVTSAINSSTSWVDTCNPNVEDLSTTFYAIVNNALDRFAPIRIRQVSKPSAPWLTPGIKTKLRQRDRLYKRAVRTRSNVLLCEYRLLRKQLKNTLKCARDEYFLRTLPCINDSAKVWSFLKKAGLVKTTHNSPLHCFLAHDLNAHYSSITHRHPQCSENDLSLILSRPIPRSRSQFSFNPVDYILVHQTALVCLSKSRGKSPDGLPLSYFKETLTFIVPLLVKLFNSSISTGIYPSIWKKSFVIPLNKISTPKSYSDTRPIANLSHIAKIFDKIIASQITSFLESNNLLSPRQSGFRRLFSTQTALLRITEDIRQAIDQGQVVVLVLFDFSKAFDSINHKLLLSAMHDLGFSDLALQWVHSYLTGRTQSVIDLDGNATDSLPNNSGVPQGSNSGPIFFIIFINTIFSYLRYCNDTCMAFADDLQLFLVSTLERLNSTISELNRDAAGVVAWSRDNGLDLNVTKTKAIIFGSSHNLNKLKSREVASVVIEGCTIPYSDNVKNLGVQFSADLSWNKHVAQISRNIHATLHGLKFRGALLSVPVKKLLVNSLVVPHVDYACIIYDDVPEYLNVKLQRLLNCALRFVFSVKRDAHISPYRRAMNWLTVKTRRNYFKCSMMYSVLTTDTPSYLRELYREVGPEVRRSRRLASSSFSLPLSRTNMLDKSFVTTSVRLWDSLPVNIKDLPSLAAFKNALFRFLFTNVDTH